MTERGRDRIESWIALALAAASVGLIAISYQFPYWKFTLHAPQYPDGLDLIIYLDHLGGRVREINGLNHYIGMAKLQEAAQFERAYAHWGVGLVCVLVAGGAVAAGRVWKWALLVPAAALPLGFIVDTQYWLYTFGHTLSPRAPIEIPPFTPSLFGRGEIGQFATFAHPSTGFWLAVAAVVLLALSLALRRSVCSRCSLRGRCRRFCSRWTVSADPQRQRAEGGSAREVA